MAFVEGAGGAPSVFDTPSNQADHNVFDVSLPIADELVPFVNWIRSLPPSERPKTAAYPMAQDPFADPPVMDVSVSRHMGLFAVARLAERHGVRVRLQARAPHGLTALVWLPDSVTERGTAHVPWAAGPGGRATAASGATAASFSSSDWFRNPRLPVAGSGGNGERLPGAAAQPDGKELLGTDGWAESQQAAQIVADPVHGDRTAAGLPMRIPRANLLPDPQAAPTGQAATRPDASQAVTRRRRPRPRGHSDRLSWLAAA